MASVRLEPSPPTPPSLATLPGDILSAIAYHLSRPDALALTYTASCFAEHLERPLWRDLKLSIYQNVGELPRTYDHPPGSGAFQRAQVEEGEKADDIYTDRLREKLKRILQQGDARRWGMTETVKLVNRPHAAHLLVVLDCVSANLRHLEIGPMPAHIAGRQTGYRDSQRLETLMIRSGLPFPALTHVSMGAGSIRYIGFIPLLCNAAPSLTWLSVEIGKVHDGRRWPFPSYDRQTQIRYLYIIIAVPLNSISLLLEASPKLEKVSLSGDGVRGINFYRPLVKHEYLEELYYEARTTDFSYFLDPDEEAGKEGFARLRTLVLRSATDDEEDCGIPFFRYLPLFPNLEALYITLPGPPPSLTCPAVQPRLHSFELLYLSLVESRRECPHLNAIKYVHLTGVTNELGSDLFTLLNQPGHAGDVIVDMRSVRHGTYELLLVSSPDRSGSVNASELKRPFTAGWRYHSELAGVSVPLVILSHVLAIEGLEFGDWKGRGHELGDAAWRYLVDWDEAWIGRDKEGS